jgi:hypothetical protein
MVRVFTFPQQVCKGELLVGFRVREDDDVE